VQGGQESGKGKAARAAHATGVEEGDHETKTSLTELPSDARENRRTAIREHGPGGDTGRKNGKVGSGKEIDQAERS